MKVGPVERDGIIIGYLVESPMTGDMYCFYTEESGERCHWTFNGDYEKPTFRPSMLNTRTGEHFFVTDGKIQYLMTSGSNKIMDMIDID